MPGDLVFYADDSGNIYHVVIYAGDNKTIEAQSSKTGIVQGTLDTADAVWAVRLLEDSISSSASGNISEVNASSDMYGENLGVFDLTYPITAPVKSAATWRPGSRLPEPR